MKVRITQKNTVWKIVQNPLKNNYYTDVMDFENDEQRGEFLNKYQFPKGKWDDLTKYVDCPVEWNDEIHFSFKIDLTSIPESERPTRSEALRKDFAIIFDENEKKWYFCTIQANFPRATKQYTQLSFKGELDVFFTYGLKNMFKKDGKIQIERQVMDNQFKDGFPNLDINNDFSFAENLNTEVAQLPFEKPKEIFSEKPNSFLVFLKPQSRDINLKANVYLSNDNLNRTFNGNAIVKDTIVIGARGDDNKVQTFYLTMEIDYDFGKEKNALGYSVGNGYFNLIRYPLYQKIGNPKSYKKENYYVPIIIPFDELENKIFDTGIDKSTLYVSDLLNSSDVIKIIPFYKNYNQNTRKLNTFVFSNNIGHKSLDFYSSLYSDVYRGINYTFEMLDDLLISSREYISIIQKFNPLNNNNFSWEQYNKMYKGENQLWMLTNSNKQSFNIKAEMLAEDISKVISISRYQTYTLQGNFGKTIIDNGYYKNGNMRNVLCLEEINNIENFLNNDMTLKKFADNAQNINVKAGIDNQNKVLGIANGTLGIASGIANTIGGGALSVFGLQGSIETDDDNNFLRKTHTYSDMLNATKGGSEGTGGLEQIGRGITQMIQSGNEIKMAAANIADAQSGKNQITTTGSEIEKIQLLDKSINSLRLQKYELPNSLKNMVAMYYHRYGYSAGGLLKNPLMCINNGRIFDYLQAEFNSVYAGLNENLSPQEAKIAALSISYGIRIWHYNENFTTVGDYSKRNIKS